MELKSLICLKRKTMKMLKEKKNLNFWFLKNDIYQSMIALIVSNKDKELHLYHLPSA